jgi:tRNA dimethylallyltransferase
MAGEKHIQPSPSIAHPRALLLGGPTATGKSEIALPLAEQLGGEIVSVDSMQVYRGLDIGTAKPSPEARRRVPHHLIDVVNLNEPFDAAQFARLARVAVQEIQARGRVPILCGGTGLYFKAFLEGLGEAPPANPALREELETIPLSDLLRELEARDPITFNKIDRKNPRRVIRAVEVIRATGKPFSAQRASWPASPASQSPQSSTFFCLARRADDLQARINARVDAMFQRGLMAETEHLLKHGLAENKTAMQAIGYRQVVEHLQGERPLTETIELVKVRTRQFAKRQMTWFRRHAAAAWINLEAQEDAVRIAGLIIERFRDESSR